MPFIMSAHKAVGMHKHLHALFHKKNFVWTESHTEGGGCLVQSDLLPVLYIARDTL